MLFLFSLNSTHHESYEEEDGMINELVLDHALTIYRTVLYTFLPQPGNPDYRPHYH